MQNLHKTNRSRRGAALIEYALLIGGVALVAAAAVAIFGHKTNDLVATTAAILPGAHADDNGPIFSGKIIETTVASPAGIAVDVNGISTNVNASRLADNLGIAAADLEALVVEP